MKLKGLGVLASLSLLSLGTGCVSSGRYDDLKQREQELAWRCEVQERATLKAESEKKLAQRETELAKEDTRIFRERLVLANEALKDTRKEVDEELKNRLAELQSKAP